MAVSENEAEISNNQLDEANKSGLYQFIWRGLFMEGLIFKAEHCDRVYEMKTRLEDLFLVSFPRSGTTWLQHLMVGILDGPEVLGQDSPYYLLSRFPFLELFVNELGTGVSGVESAENYVHENPRCLKTHFPHEFAPAEIVSEKRKIVVILRNVKDVAQSFYEFYQNSPALTKFQAKNWEEFVERFLLGNVAYGSWWSWVNGWCEYYQNESKLCKETGEKCHVLLMIYENLHKDFAVEIERLHKFLLPSSTLTNLSQIITNLRIKCSITSMKEIYSNSNYLLKDFVAFGNVARWKYQFTYEQRTKFDEKTKSELGKFGDLLSSWDEMND